MIISFVVAVSENGVIGRDNDMPWRLSTDLKRFKALTMGKPVVMGRKTWETLGRPLPGRSNIVVTRKSDYQAEGALVVPSIEAALDEGHRQAAALGTNEICIIGGAQIYRQAFDHANVLHVTHILESIEGDAHFGSINPDQWQAVSQEDVGTGEKDNYPTRYVVYRRTE